jgi:capsular exopolysaccharide synthesis family protein
VNDQPFSEGGGESRRAPHREVHLRDLATVVVRHWILVILLAGLVGAGAFYSGRRIIPAYQSSLTVQISSPKQVFARLDDIDIDELALRTDPILSEALVLTTQGLALKVVDAQGLQLQLADPLLRRGEVLADISIDQGDAAPGAWQLVVGAQGYQLLDVAGTVLAAGPLNETVVGPGFSFRIIPPLEETTVDLRLASREAAAAGVTGGLSYRVRQGTNAVDLSYTGTDPTIVPLILNAAAFQLRNLGVERALVSARSRRRYIEAQIEESESLLQQSQRNLQEFRETRQISNLTAQETAIVQTIQRLEQDRQEELMRISTIRDAMTASDTVGIEALNRLAATEGIGDNAAMTFQIRGLLQLYDERRELTAGALGLREGNPQVSSIDEQIRQSHAALQNAVDAALRTIRSRLDALEAELARQRGVLSRFPGMETSIGQLSLESSILDETHRYLLSQYQQSRMQEATIAPYIQILDDASRPFRIGTSLRQRIILGVLVGLLLGLAGAFFLEYLDQTVKTSADIERVLGVPVLGSIPHDPKLAPRSQGRRGGMVTISHLDPDEPSVESYRALRTNVTFVGAEKPLQFISVTSPAPREGKSTTAINLALTLAQSGRRTILIDGDLRRSSVHRAFGLVQEPGLTDILIGGVSASEGIRPDIAPALDLLPSGSTPPNPSELLGSAAMDALIAELRHDYEYIIMDTPPTLPVTDAAVVATNADATILVIKSGDTEESSAQRAMHQLRRVRARIAGAVLNSVTPRKDPQYSYYSYSYRKDPPSRSRIRATASKIAGMI